MYYKDDLLSKDISELMDIAKELGADYSDNDSKETLVYEILEKQAVVEAAKSPLSTKRKRTRIVKNNTDHVYSVNGKEGENLETKKGKAAQNETLPLFKEALEHKQEITENTDMPNPDVTEMEETPKKSTEKKTTRGKGKIAEQESIEEPLPQEEIQVSDNSFDEIAVDGGKDLTEEDSSFIVPEADFQPADGQEDSGDLIERLRSKVNARKEETGSIAGDMADFDKDLFDYIYNDDSEEKEFSHHIYGYDIDMASVAKARLNVKAAGLTQEITIKQADFKDFTQPKEKSILIMNPPYGERISTPDILATYRLIGERLKHQFVNNDAWILSYREECFEQIGLKPSIKIPLFNGSLECEFRKYQLFDGKMKVFRHEGGQVKNDEEKKAMAEQHRFKKNREFKKRIEENEENENGDIRTFKFHSRPITIQKGRERKENTPTKYGKERKPKFGKEYPKDKRFKGNNFGNKNRRYNHED